MKSGGNLGASPKFGWLDPMPPIETPLSVVTTSRLVKAWWRPKP